MTIDSEWVIFTWGLIKPRIWTSVITCYWTLQKHFIPTMNNLLGPHHRRQWKDSRFGANQLEDCRWSQTFQCATQNSSVVATSSTRNWNHLEPSMKWVTSRNHIVKELAYSPQTSMGAVEIIHKNCCRKLGHHIARISTRTARNHLRRLTLCARRPYWGPILNRQWRAARLHWVTVQRLSFLNLPHIWLT